MVQITGKYQLVENKNFYEFMLAVGAPEERAKAANKTGSILEVSVEGKKIICKNESPQYVTELVLDEEVEEKMPPDLVLLSTAKLDGNTITVKSKLKDGTPASVRTWVFGDSQLDSTITAEKDGKTLSASRIYKRI
ncbi:hypothetical protein NQ315_008711 [Exocentrus adspersus]|uniref:Uncharacterized protein n=1 Tax=Exocentrus adspersus TaxID=1586481 RepID=A0AAV8W7R1_9CUCU|nr:hypothetical protein NQ315_008711 [Exocentrus adspersus]